MSAPKVVLVAKETAYGRYIEDEEDAHARRLIRRGDISVARWKKAHQNHVATLKLVHRVLKTAGATVWQVRGAQVAFDPTDAVLVVAVGGDGTLLAASHHMNRVPVLGVNSSPEHSVGFFCAARSENVTQKLEAALLGKLAKIKLSRMEVALNGRTISRHVLNEALFCHAIPAATSRYILRCGRSREEQRSSGIWVSTAAGSTGAAHSAGGKLMPFSSKRIQAVVREPYLVMGKPYRMSRIEIPNTAKLTVQSKMQDARLFLDGPYTQTKVGLGDTITMQTSPEPLTVLGLNAKRRTVPVK